MRLKQFAFLLLVFAFIIVLSYFAVSFFGPYCCPSVLGDSTERIVEMCGWMDNNYSCNSLADCGEKGLKSCEESEPYNEYDLPCAPNPLGGGIGARDWCLVDQTVYAKNPKEVCNAIEKEFIKDYCLQAKVFKN